MHLDQKISLKNLHTFGVEAEARYFVEAKTHSEVLTLLNYRHMIHMPILFLGGGSNVLFTKDFAGIVIRINSKGIVVREETDHHVLVTAEAGENWDDFVHFCVNNQWAGIENLSLIPGTVGAAPIQNIGAYGVEVKDVIDSVQTIDISSGKQKRYSNVECEFGYRDSIFKRVLKGKVIILNVTFRLGKIGVAGSNKVTKLQSDGVTKLQSDKGGGGKVFKLDYGEIRAELERAGVANVTISAVREAICNIRRRKLPDPAEIGNAGSFFKNPVISGEQKAVLQNQFPDMPFYVLEPGEDQEPRVKIPAAWLIEQCGWKGYRNGDAGVYPTQPLVLVNYGSATGLQISALASQIQQSVKLKFGISLETEVNIIG